MPSPDVTRAQRLAQEVKGALVALRAELIIRIEALEARAGLDKATEPKKAKPKGGK